MLRLLCSKRQTFPIHPTPAYGNELIKTPCHVETMSLGGYACPSGVTCSFLCQAQTTPHSLLGCFLLGCRRPLQGAALTVIMGKGGRQRHTSTFVSTHYLHVLASYPIRCLSRQVLGIPRDADSNAINRAYTQKKYAARGNDSLTKKIEAAHSQLMMSALTARLKVLHACITFLATLSRAYV